MKTITVPCTITLAAALGANRASYGDVDVALTDDAVASLSPRAKAIVERRLRSSTRTLLPTADASPTAVVEALEAEARAEAEAEEKAKAEREARIAKAIEAPIESWILTNSWSDEPYLAAPAIYGDELRDPRLAARQREAEALLRPRHQAWQADRDAAKAAREAKEAAEAEAKEAAKERAKRGAIAYAIEHCPEIREAAEAEYEIKGAVANAYATTLAREFDRTPGPRCEWRILRERTSAYNNTSWEERAAPSSIVVRAQQRLAKIAESTPRPDGWDVEVLRVQRVSPPEDENGEQPSHYTALVAVISSPITDDRVLIIDVDSL